MSTRTRTNGSRTTTEIVSSETLAQALVQEQRIADEAAEIRGDQVGMTPELFVKLRSLLRTPFHDGLITSLGVCDGKPYASTGLRSVQVQHDRMNNVLTEVGWNELIEYHEEGKLAQVIVRVVDLDGNVIFARESWGGVNRGSTLGNLRKGSYTNAAKVAFARIGPGREVYIGATGFDPDVDESAAKEQVKSPRAETPGKPAEETPLSAEQCDRVRVSVLDAGVDEKTRKLWLVAVGAESWETLTIKQAWDLKEKLNEFEAARGGKQ